MITLALIGVGRWGKNYLQTVKQLPNVTIKYLCSKNLSHLSQRPDSYVKLTNYKELLKYDDIDGVIIATNAATHFEILSFLLKNNFNVLVEKPFVTSSQQAAEIKKKYQKQNAFCMVGHIYLYNPAFVKLLELLPSIGQIQYIQMDGYNFGPIRNDVSALWDWSPHDIAMSLAIMQEKPITVSAWGINVLKRNKHLYDMVFIRLEFSNNVYSFIRNGWLSPIKERKTMVVGTKKSIIFDDTQEKKLTTIEDGRSLIQNYPHGTPLRHELHVFIENIMSKRKNKKYIQEGIDVIKILECAEQSITLNGQAVKIK